jgi:hypothetical protein
VRIKYCFILGTLTVMLLLLLCSCSGASSNSTAVSKPNAVPAATEPEAPVVTMPATDKSKSPVIQFSVSPTSVPPGGTAVLTWNVTNATSVTIDHGIGTVAAAGTSKVSPAGPVTYKLTASNADASAIKTVSLAVVSATPPPATPPPTPPKTGK